MGRLTRTGLLLSSIAFLASPGSAQNPAAPRYASFDYLDLRMLIAPDSEGTWVWTSTGEPGQPGSKAFSATFDPAALTRWVTQARTFAAQNLTREDSGNSRTSPAITTAEGERVYVVRRRSRGMWTDELFLMLQQADTTEPVAVAGTDYTIGRILDSLFAVGMRTPRRADADTAGARPRKFDKHARTASGSRPPVYPRGARARGLEGTVLATFIVKADGLADMSTFIVVRSPDKDFTKAVIDQLPRIAFEPAVSDGLPVRERVLMPFAFKLYRGRLR